MKIIKAIILIALFTVSQYGIRKDKSYGYLAGAFQFMYTIFLFIIA